MHANPFASLIDPASAIAIAQRAHRLRRLGPTGSAMSAVFDLGFVDEKPREYRPSARTQKLLNILRTAGPLSSADLSRRSDVPSKHIYACLAIALAHGAVRRTSTAPIKWSVS